MRQPGQKGDRSIVPATGWVRHIAGPDRGAQTPATRAPEISVEGCTADALPTLVRALYGPSLIDGNQPDSTVRGNCMERGCQPRISTESGSSGGNTSPAARRRNERKDTGLLSQTLPATWRHEPARRTFACEMRAIGPARVSPSRINVEIRPPRACSS